MRRLLTALVVALVVASMLPLPVFAMVTAQADAATTDEDAQVVITLQASDDSGQDITDFGVSVPEHGVLGSFGTIVCDGATPDVCTQDVTYTPDADYFGTDSFTITPTGAGGTADPATIDITVNAVNDPPSFTAGSDVSAATTGAFTQSGWATGISSGPGESDGLTFIVDVPVADAGLFSVAPAVDPSTGDLTFTPSGTAGETTVSVTLQDDGTPPLESAAASLTITLADGPTADPQTITVNEGSHDNAITLTGTDPQAGALTFAIETQPTHGTLGGSAPNVTYTPATGYNGPDSFTFTVANGVATSAPATVAITVTGVKAKNDVLAITATTTSKLDVLANDSAGSGKTIADLTIVSVTSPPTLGTPTISSDGAFLTFDPSGCRTGTESFTYTISDGTTQKTAAVALTVNRPGQGGLSRAPITDTPGAQFVTNSTIGSTIPTKVSWCGVTASGYSVRSYRLIQNINGGSFSTLISATTARSSVRNLGTNRDYRWKVRTVDSAGRIGAYRSSLTTRLTKYENTSASITYQGSWVTHTTTSASGGSERYASRADASASLTVSNIRSFAIVGPMSSTRGSFTVYVDDVPVRTVSEKASTLVYRRVLYVRSVTGGTHTIRIMPVGGARIDLDAILTLRNP